MVDKVKPLKIESTSTGGSQDNPYPVETDPAQDYIASKGIAFGGTDNFLLDKLGRAMAEKYPDTWHEITYSSGVPVAIEFFNSPTFITANRISRSDIAYSSGVPTTETIKIYGDDGTTILRTYTYTYTFGSGVLNSAKVEIT